MRDANLIRKYRPIVDLRGADLRKAELASAELNGLHLSKANLSEAILNGANLRGANLHGADLHGADLHGAILSRADLSRANLRGTDLCGADLRGAKLSSEQLAQTKFDERTLMDDALRQGCRSHSSQSPSDDVRLAASRTAGGMAVYAIPRQAVVRQLHDSLVLHTALSTARSRWLMHVALRKGA